MPHFISIFSIVAYWTVTVLNGISLQAGQSFSLSTRTVEIPENGTVEHLVMRTSNIEISFQPPAGWKADINTNSGVIAWVSSDYATMLSLKIESEGSEKAPSLKPEDFRKLLLAERPTAKVREEFPCHAANASGIGFDVEQNTDAAPSNCSRIAYIPVQGGVAQITLSTSSAEFDRRQITFTRFLNSLRVVPARL